MAKKQKPQQNLQDKPKIRGMMDFIQTNMSKLYQNTYFTSYDNSGSLNNIKSDITKSIDTIVGTNSEKTGSGNISALYDRLAKSDDVDTKNGDIKDLEALFNETAINTDITGSAMSNKAIKEYDQEIDIICKYMPSLEDALDAKKDNVLSADNFTKDFINVVDLSGSVDIDIFNNNIKKLKDDYNLVEKLESIYDKTAKYGECFVYVVPYSKAFTQLLNANKRSVNESASIDETICITNENVQILGEADMHSPSVRKAMNNENSYNIRLNINTSMVLTESVNEVNTIKQFNRKLDKTINDDITFDSPEYATDGFIDDKTKEVKEDEIKVKGCIIKELKRENVIPLYIEDSCLGYYHIECQNEDLFEDDHMLNNHAGMFNRNLIMSTNQKLTLEDQVLKNISSKIANKLNTEFINANPDLKNEIYKILRYNSNSEKLSSINISFLPPSDVIHSYFKLDPITHRGISDLDRALFPAKIFASIYVTNSLGIITRSQDKRVYYVKQNVDTNISGTLLNTINQIKKSNFGAREFGNFKNLMNIVGRYNEHVIPVGSSGDSPINFEIMPGQQIDTQDDFLDRLEEMAVNTTDVPFEYIQSRKTVDYAVRLTISSGKFLRKTFKRQSKTEAIFTRIINKLYKSEFENEQTITSANLKVMLPPPSLLNIINTNQMFDNLEQYTTAISNMMYNDSDDPNNQLRPIFISKLKKHYSGTVIDLATISRLKQESELEYNKLQTKNSEGE